MWRPWGSPVMTVKPQYNIVPTLERLHLASLSGYLHLEEVATVEKDRLPPWSQTQLFVSPTTVDHVSEEYLRECKLQELGVPFKVSDNGSCLFNAVSVALCGTENFATELRVRTCVEMVVNKERYTSHPKAKDLIWVSPNFISSTIDCAQPRGWSSIWTILALAQVIGRPIRSVYPPLNGIQDMSFKILNLTAIPKDCIDEDIVTILWTRSSPNNKTKIWIPDHFTPILPIPTVMLDESFKMNSIPSIDDTDEFPPLSRLSEPSSPMPTIHKTNLFTEESNEPIVINNDSSISDTLTEEPENSFHLPASVPNSTPLQNGQNLTASELFSLVTNDNITVMQDIPKGFKDNMFFCLETKTNLPSARYPDDCGSWDTHCGRTVKSDFVLVDNKLKFTIKKDNVYHYEKKTKGKKTLIKFDPQPEHVITLHRYYTALKRDKSYRKRASWFSNLPPELISRNVTVVEYTGLCPRENIPHGNAKHSTQEYIRTDPKVLEKIKSELQHKQTCSDIYKTMVLEDPESAPRDYHQIRNTKYNQKKQAKVSTTSNVADEFIEIMGLVNTDDFVKEVVYTQDSKKPPAVICYTPETLTDMQNYLKIDTDRIIGIDRTFNLGSVYVTNLVYKNKKVISKESGDHPIFIGPIFLHWEGSFLSYHTFLSHVKARLQETVSCIDLRIGSDDEKGLTKALDSVFPESTRLLCTKHMKDNVADHLKNSVGVNDKQRVDIVNKIFGPSGIATADDTFDFDTKMEEVIEEYPIMTNYLETRLKDRLRDHVSKPRKKLNQDRLWTNNNCESINHVFKRAVDWKPQPIPELISSLKKVVKVHFADLKRSLFGTGNYQLHGYFQKYGVTHQIWFSKSAEEKNELYKKLLMDGKIRNVTLKSKCGKLEVPIHQRVAKKPNQRKRPRANRAEKRYL